MKEKVRFLFDRCKKKLDQFFSRKKLTTLSFGNKEISCSSLKSYEVGIVDLSGTEAI